jgi:hypothetical protein
MAAGFVVILHGATRTQELNQHIQQNLAGMLKF